MSHSTVNGAESTEPVFFWKPGEETWGFLSQWYESPFEVDGVRYESAEMWMMIQKAKLFGDEVQDFLNSGSIPRTSNVRQDIAKQMMQTTSPKEHQALGRKAKGFDRQKWDNEKSRIVEEGNYHKFTKSRDAEHMLKTLLGTGDRELVETSPVDRIWGVGFDAANAEANRDKWGENRLGEAIMKVRDQLRKEGR